MPSIPPADFRQFNVWPEPYELQGNVKPNLRENIVKGKYDGVKHYLDVHFRLLREDFIRPFRERICDFIRTKDEADESKRPAIDKKSNAYRDVCIVNGGGYKGTLEIPFANITWEGGNTLNKGSLIAVSSDNFQTIIFATITGHVSKGSAKNGGKGRIEVRFQHRAQHFGQKTFVMIEAPVHFEPYRKSFKVLQRLVKPPLTKYIVEVDRNIAPPSYVSLNNVYRISNGLPGDERQTESAAVMIKLKELISKNFDDFGLNESQYRAFCAAFTKQLVLIQGSPGTGETYLGLRIVQTLLEIGCPLPIVLICNTSHALDQFLEGVLRFCDKKDLVLVGDGSKSAILKECNLKEAKSEIPGKHKKKKVAAVAKVIGMTSPEAAKNQKIMNTTQAKITIVLEATQMLEAHSIAAMSKHTEHLILIGDLTQPRPKNAVDELATKFNFNISLFERLILNGIEYHELAEQCRVRTEVTSSLPSLTCDEHQLAEQRPIPMRPDNAPSLLPQTHEEPLLNDTIVSKNEVADGFRQINICPEPDELQWNVEPILRENIVKGKYDDVEHYLDVHFRLLREDFVRPFRERVCEFIRAKNESERDKMLYRNVEMVRRHRANLRYDCSYITKNHLKIDEILKKGSLVALSMDDFRTLFLSPITARHESKKLVGTGSTEGRFEILFELRLRTERINRKKKLDFDMIEAPVHFEAYRNSLMVLREFDKYNFPLAKYIVKVDKNIAPPSYVSQETVYQISNGLPVDDQPPKSIAVQIMKESSFNEKGCDEFGLNESQFKAFRAALTKQLVLIQGSPGTGKTYLGLRIVQTLLENGCPLPIVVICNTSHALDQFLEGVVRFCDKKDLILVGDGSKSAILKECHLKEAISEIPGKHKRKQAARQAKVIGMTSEGPAKNQPLWNEIKPKITIVEEAAHVLEAHLVTALSECTDHLILFGDHSQPRPKNAVDELATKYKLNISLFERLILNEMVCHQLVKEYRVSPGVVSSLPTHTHVDNNRSTIGHQLGEQRPLRPEIAPPFLSETHEEPLLKHPIVNQNEPIGNFRQTNVSPKPDELRSDLKPNLRENIVKGKYDDVEHYLDVHFRLLREDFVRPLREGVCAFIRTKDEADGREGDKMLNVYRNVRMVGRKGANIRYHCAVHTKNDWKIDDILKKGSLVALSMDDFKTIFYASIAARHDPEKSGGQSSGQERFEIPFELRITDERIVKEKTLVMIEAPVHFEAYRNSLLGLREFDKHNFPLAKYIVEVDKNIAPPSHISQETVYRISNGFPANDQPARSKAVQIMKESSFNGMRCDDFGLNELQYKAFRAALTKQLTIIQGAPGTGKTYLGLRIVQTLLENGCPLPIVVICNTIHALDQFLEGVLRFCNKKEMIIIGDDTKSEILRECNLTEVIAEIPGKRNKKQVARKAKVIGMTPTEVGKDRRFWKKNKSEITIVEEATQMLEAHLVNALSNRTDHLILIGDHTQPRPKNAVDELATKFNMNISLFERLISNGMEYHELAEQCRVRTEVTSSLPSLTRVEHQLAEQRPIPMRPDNAPSLLPQTHEEPLLNDTIVSENEVADGFRQINICPEANELQRNVKPNLCENIVKGKYDGVEHYLDVHFRLLREDFVRPFRELICEFIRTQDEADESKRAEIDKNLIVYRSVCKKVSKAKATFQFDPTPFGNVDWTSNERFKGGSLVALSSDDFETIIFATFSADRKKKADDTFILSFEFGTKISNLDENGAFIVIEAPVYFETYRHNLSVLQKFGDNNFPLAKYIVEVDKNIAPPSYISQETVYRISNAFPVDDQPLESVAVQILEGSSFNGKSCDDFGLNESQFKAFRSALTKQLTIIQGPPGTGKSYLGLRIVQTLLTNKCPLPILVVCYTNHALDQFLEGVLRFCDPKELIRVGGGSESELLKECNLTRAKKNVKTRGKEKEIQAARQAKVIGMTSTGAAKYQYLVNKIKAKITIIEEAAQVLEAHVVTALSKHTDHLILIGDHKQLKPRNEVHELATKYKLNVSLFERFILNGMEYHQLAEQRRMRPEIASLLLPQTYEVPLLNHPMVSKYEDVKGFFKNTFFVNHQHSESLGEDGLSFTNSHEASFIVGLCKYLIQQGYTPAQVTILTTYNAQLAMITGLLKEDSVMEKIHATTVDGFQGEENDIILLSFVRSNKDNVIGFLGMANRATVALTRAKEGFFCIGNFKQMADSSRRRRGNRYRWDELVANLKRDGGIGDALELRCQIHGTKSMVKTRDDFRIRSPSGGCSIMCNARSRCGHTCERPCHILDNEEHITMQLKCSARCNRTCAKGHRCLDICHYTEECGGCYVKVEKLRPDCGHIVRVPCSVNPSSVECHKPCEKNRHCGHKCRGTCSQICDELICTRKVEAKSRCQHTVVIKCSDSKDDSKLLKACTAPCTVNLECGHQCKGSCGQCQFGRLHIICREQCTKTPTCDHLCPRECLWIERPAHINVIKALKTKIELVLKSNENLPPYLDETFSELSKRINANDARNSVINLIAVKYDYSEILRQIDQSMRKRLSFRSCSAKILEKFDERIRVLASFVIKDLGDCVQQRNDALIEISFLKLMADAIIEADARPMFDAGRQHLNSAFELAHFNGAATDEIRSQFRRHVSEALRSRYSISDDSKTWLCIITIILIIISYVVVLRCFS